MKIDQLTDIQYEILSRLETDYAYNFNAFDDLNLTKNELSKEFKILREAGLVYFSNGLMTEEGYTAGSGYGLEDRAKEERYKLMDNYEERKAGKHE